MTDVVNVGSLDADASVPVTPHEHSRTGLSPDALRRAISDHLTYSIARPAAALTTEHPLQPFSPRYFAPDAPRAPAVTTGLYWPPPASPRA